MECAWCSQHLHRVHGWHEHSFSDVAVADLFTVSVFQTRLYLLIKKIFN